MSEKRPSKQAKDDLERAKRIAEGDIYGPTSHSSYLDPSDYLELSRSPAGRAINDLYFSVHDIKACLGLLFAALDTRALLEAGVPARQKKYDEKIAQELASCAERRAAAKQKQLEAKARKATRAR